MTNTRQTSPPDLQGADSTEVTRPATSNPNPPNHTSTASSTTLTTSMPMDPVAALHPTIEDLVAGLKSLEGTNAVLVAEFTALWRTNLQQLVEAGSGAVPAIQTFLQREADNPFTQEVREAVGYNSARLAALDVLRQIGGPEAIAALETILGTAQSPREIAVLARNLEETSPGHYRQQAIEAARRGLASAAQAIDPQPDLAPLFEVFQRYGDASVIPDLERALGRWEYYASIALANLHGGVGVPSILRLADPSAGNGHEVVALEMVAQLAASNSEARQFLLTQAANKGIPPNLWPYLVSPLAGGQYFPFHAEITSYPQLQSWSDLKITHIEFGNQNLYTIPGSQNLTRDGINQQLALIDELLKAASDPAALEALQQARHTLAQRPSRGLVQLQTGGAAAE